MRSPESPDDGAEQPADVAAMLDLIRSEQDRMSRRLAAGVPAILLAWGIAWFVGFLLLWLIDGARPVVAIPVAVAASAFALLMTGAIVVSAVMGARMGRGIRPAPGAAWTGTVYGLTWPVGFLAILALGRALIVNGMAPELSSIYYPTASTIFVGIMYVLAGAIWRNWQSIAMGGWFIVVAAIAPFFGYPTHYLVFAIAAGGVFLLGALVAWLWQRESGRRPVVAEDIDE
ncbi:hypothetical protein K0817_014465 [Microbacterium sp. HD4P20]|uniref:hypothetical protein n=1 Tax=Microbacterium sp. HD4P20 TaxID=2864874 RepID=UPI001C6434B8|nr:hypothetical protein [Microbacterium sp. HD4P20]MCP2637757.1 hypothetical protein [Microbacterium sp. HD4P20]